MHLFDSLWLSFLTDYDISDSVACYYCTMALCSNSNNNRNKSIVKMARSAEFLRTLKLTWGKVSQGKAFGLLLSVDKSKVFHSESSASPVLSAFPGVQYLHVSHAILLGSPLERKALQAYIEEQSHQLKVMGAQPCHLQMHNSITIL